MILFAVWKLQLETSVAEGELEEALRMSRYQFDLEEKGRKDQMGSLETEEERLLAQVRYLSV